MNMGHLCLVITYLYLQGVFAVIKEKKPTNGEQLLWNKRPIEIVGVDHVVDKVGYSNKTKVPQKPDRKNDSYSNKANVLQKPHRKNEYVGVKLSEYIGDMIKSQESLLEKMINFNMGGMDIIESVEKLPKEAASELPTEQFPEAVRATELPSEQKMEIASELLTEQLPKAMHASELPTEQKIEIASELLTEQLPKAIHAGELPTEQKMEIASELLTEQLPKTETTDPVGSEHSLNGLKDAVGFIESLPPNFEQRFLDPNYKEPGHESFSDYMYTNMEESLLLGKNYKNPDTKSFENKKEVSNKESYHSIQGENSVNGMSNQDIGTLEVTAQTNVEQKNPQGSEQVNQFGFAISHPDKNALKRLEETFPLVYQTTDKTPTVNELSSAAVSANEVSQSQVNHNNEVVHIPKSTNEEGTKTLVAADSPVSPTMNLENTVIHSHSSSNIADKQGIQMFADNNAVKLDTTSTNTEKVLVESSNEGIPFVHQHSDMKQIAVRAMPTQKVSHSSFTESALNSNENFVGTPANTGQAKIASNVDSAKVPITIDANKDSDKPPSKANIYSMETPKIDESKPSQALLASEKIPKLEQTPVKFSMKSHPSKSKTGIVTKLYRNEGSNALKQHSSPEIAEKQNAVPSINIQPGGIPSKIKKEINQNTAYSTKVHTHDHIDAKKSHTVSVIPSINHSHEKLMASDASYTTADHPQQITLNPNTRRTAAKRTHEMSVNTATRNSYQITVNPEQGTKGKKYTKVSFDQNPKYTTASHRLDLSVSQNSGRTTSGRESEISVIPNSGHTVAEHTHRMSVSQETGNTAAASQIPGNQNSQYAPADHTHEMLVNAKTDQITADGFRQISVNPNTEFKVTSYTDGSSGSPSFSAALVQEMPVKPALGSAKEISIDPSIATEYTITPKVTRNSGQTSAASSNQNIELAAPKHTQDVSALDNSGITFGSHEKKQFTTHHPEPTKRFDLDKHSYNKINKDVQHSNSKHLHGENHFLDGRFLGNIHEPQTSFVDNAQSFVITGSDGKINQNSIGNTVHTNEIKMNSGTSSFESRVKGEQIMPAISISIETSGNMKGYDSQNNLGEPNGNLDVMNNAYNQFERQESGVSLTIPENKGKVLSPNFSGNRASFSYKQNAEKGLFKSDTNGNFQDMELQGQTSFVTKEGPIIQRDSVTPFIKIKGSSSYPEGSKNIYDAPGKEGLSNKIKQQIKIEAAKDPSFSVENIKQVNLPVKIKQNENEANSRVLEGTISGTVSGAVASYGSQGARSGFSHSTRPYVPVIDYTRDQNHIFPVSSNSHAKVSATDSASSFSNNAMISAENTLTKEKHSRSHENVSPFENQFNDVHSHRPSNPELSESTQINIDTSRNQNKLTNSPSGISKHVPVYTPKEKNLDPAHNDKEKVIGNGVSIEILKPTENEKQSGKKTQVVENYLTDGQDINSNKIDSHGKRLIKEPELIPNSLKQKGKLYGIQKPFKYSVKQNTENSLNVNEKVETLQTKEANIGGSYKTKLEIKSGTPSLSEIVQGQKQKVEKKISTGMNSDKPTATKSLSIQGRNGKKKLNLHHGGKVNSTVSMSERKTKGKALKKYTSALHKQRNFLSLPKSRKAKSLLVAVLSGLKKRGLKIRNFAALKKIVSAIKILAARLQARRALRTKHVVVKPKLRTHYISDDDDDSDDTNENDDNDYIHTHPNNV